jgi:hypothetical protein
MIICQSITSAAFVQTMALYGVHFPWFGVGHVAEEKDGFRYFPEAVGQRDADVTRIIRNAARVQRQTLIRVLTKAKKTGRA